MDIGTEDVRADGLGHGLAWDLAAADGALSEIATCWRRAAATQPALPLRLPIVLQQAARQVRADVRSLACAAPGQRADLARDASARVAQLRRDVAAARSLTQGASARTADGLWDSVSAALGRADRQLHGIADGATAG